MDVTDRIAGTASDHLTMDGYVAYLNGYSERFGLASKVGTEWDGTALEGRSRIQFGTKVDRVERAEGGHSVTFTGPTGQLEPPLGGERILTRIGGRNSYVVCSCDIDLYGSARHPCRPLYPWTRASAGAGHSGFDEGGIAHFPTWCRGEEAGNEGHSLFSVQEEGGVQG
jgi:hypothetical protein